MTEAFRAISNAIQTLNEAIGKCLSWLIAIMAITVFIVVVARTFFNYGSIAMQESVTYMHATVIMLCLAYTAKQGGHVRVDIFYQHMSETGKAWVNACGTIVFLLPFSFFLIFVSWRFVEVSWQDLEGSINPGGIPFVYVLKTIIPISGVLLALQGLAEVINNLLTLTFRPETSTEP